MDYYKCDPNEINTFHEEFCADDCRFSAYIQHDYTASWTPARFTFEGYSHFEGGNPLTGSFFFNVCPNCGRILNEDGTVTEMESDKDG